MKFSKRILSLMLSLLMVVTSVPAFVISAQAADTDKYLFAYFTGNEDVTTTSSENQAIRFAVSSDNRNFTVLNSGNPVIKQSKGALNCRDPYIFLGQDGWFYVIATDMDSNGGNSWWGNSNSFVLWRSKDLINWQDETIINMSSVLGINVARAWAPQVIWDNNKGEYMIYFGLAENEGNGQYANYTAGNNTHMYYVHTSDLLDQSKYSTTAYPLVESAYTESSKDSIDGDITYADGKYYLFYKDEGSGTICVATSDFVTGPYNSTKTVLEDNSVSSLEGCQVYQDNDGNYIFMADWYNNNGNFVVYNLGRSLADVFAGNPATLNVEQYKITDTNVNSNCKPRHGSMLKITTKQYNDLLNAQSFSTIVSATESGIGSVVGNVEENNGIDLSSNLLARYFVYDSTTDENGGNYDLSSVGSVQWQQEANAGRGAAYFTPDNYVYTSEASQMLSSVNAETGITVSFYGNPESSCDANGRFFEFNDKGIKGTVIWDITSQNTSYISMYNSSVLEMANNRSGSGSWPGTSDSASFVNSEKDAWNQYTVTIQNNNVSLYINGVSQGTKTLGVNASEIFNDIKSIGYLLIGATGWPDNTYTGYMRDFRVYNKAINAEEAAKLYNQYSYDNNAFTVDDLKALMTKCEQKFADISSTSTVYANMSDAYEAYVNANKFYDAYYYGAQTELADQADSYAVALDKALNRMTEWTAKTGTAVGSFADDSAENSWGKEDFYKNLLYTEPVADYNNYAQNNYSENAIYYSPTVMLYDGVTSPQTGILLWSKKLSSGWSSKTRKIYAANVSNSEFSFIGNWKGGTNNRDFMRLMRTQGDTIGTSAEDGLLLQIGSGTGASNVVYSANVMKFSGSFANDEYYKELYPSFFCRWTADYIKDDIDITVNGTNPIYVINYKAINDAISSVKTSYYPIIQNVSSYKEGGLLELLSAIDTITSIDPNNYDYSSNTSAQVAACASSIQSAVNSFNSVSTPVADSSGYQAFRDIFDANIDIYNENVGNPSSIYSTSSVDDYGNLCQAGMAVMRQPLASDYNSADSSKVGEIAAAITADPTQTVLNPKVDTSALSAEIESARGMSIFSGDVQVHTLQCWIELNELADSAEGTMNSYADAGKYASQSETAGGVNYQKINTAASSDGQTAVNDAVTALQNYEHNEIIDEELQSFDSACQVASTIPVSSYDSDYRNETINVVDKLHDAVYMSVEDAAATPGLEIPEGFKGEIVNTVDNLDDKTRQILNQLGELESNYALYSVTIIQNDSSSETNSIEYGKPVSLPSQSVPGVWEIVSSAGTTNIPVPADKEAVITVESDITATFTANVYVTDTYDYQINVYDKFNKLTNIVYVSGQQTNEAISDVLAEKGIKAKTIPFYTFGGWSISINEAAKTYTVKPKYVYDTNVTYKVYVNGELQGKYNYDSPVVVSVSEGQGVPYGWVNRTAEGKYQIVSYSDSYKFYACADCDLYPLYKEDDGGYGKYYVNEINEENLLTFEKVDGNILPKGYTGMTEEEHLNFKLYNEYPFIYVDGTKQVEDNKYRVYAKFTEGATKYMAFGVIVTYGGDEGKFNASNKTDSNQFMFTITINGTLDQEEINFKPYVNHWFEYMGKTIDAFYYDEATLVVNKEEV